MKLRNSVPARRACVIALGSVAVAVGPSAVAPSAAAFAPSAAALAPSAAALTPSAVAAGHPRRSVPVPAKLVYLDTSQASSCSWGIGIEFKAAPRAVAYTISYYDGFYHRQERESATLSELKAADLVVGRQGSIPRGSLFIGIVGGTHRPPCQADGDPTDGGRFGTRARAWATPGRFELSGSVMAERCGPHACKLKPRAGITVVARAQGRAGGGRARTTKSGRYSLALAPGTYTVAPRGRGSIPGTQLALLDHAASGVDFRTCGGSRPASCERTVQIAVSDLAGDPLPGVRVLARADGPAGAASDAAASTNARGRARLKLSDGSWQVFLARSLGALEPAGTVVGPANSDPTLEVPGTFYTYASGCGGGHRRAGGGCVYRLGSSAGARASMTARVEVAPIDVSLAHGLGGGSVVVLPAAAPGGETLSWNGATDPRNRVRLEYWLTAETTLDVLAFHGQGNPGGAVPVRSCRPGAAGSTAFGPVCVLQLSPGRARRGQAAFKLS